MNRQVKKTSERIARLFNETEDPEERREAMQALLELVSHLARHHDTPRPVQVQYDDERYEPLVSASADAPPNLDFLLSRIHERLAELERKAEAASVAVARVAQFDAAIAQADATARKAVGEVGATKLTLGATVNRFGERLAELEQRSKGRFQAIDEELKGLTEQYGHLDTWQADADRELTGVVQRVEVLQAALGIMGFTQTIRLPRPGDPPDEQGNVKERVDVLDKRITEVGLLCRELQKVVLNIEDYLDTYDDYSLSAFAQMRAVEEADEPPPSRP